MSLLNTRQAVLASRGYDSLVAAPEDFDDKLRFGKFDLVILSVMLSQKQRGYILTKLPVGTRSLVLERLMFPDELLHLVSKALS